MNKSLTVAILALVCLTTVKAELDDKDYSEHRIATDDWTETAKLGEQFQEFEQFCLQSRDYVLNEIKTSTNQLAANVFSLIFETADVMGRESVGVQRMGTERLTKQLAKPDLPIGPATNEAEQIIADGQKKVQELGQPMGWLEAAKSIARATSATFFSMLDERMNRIKSSVNVDTLATTFASACEKVQAYEDKLLDSFEAYKSSLTSGNEELSKLTMDKVPCVTASRISRADGVCKFAIAVKNATDKTRVSRVNSRAN